MKRRMVKMWFQPMFSTIPWLVGKIITSWWLNQPNWKICASQIGSFPQVGVKIKHLWNHHLEKTDPWSLCLWVQTVFNFFSDTWVYIILLVWETKKPCADGNIPGLLFDRQRLASVNYILDTTWCVCVYVSPSFHGCLGVYWLKRLRVDAVKIIEMPL